MSDSKKNGPRSYGPNFQRHTVPPNKIGLSSGASLDLLRMETSSPAGISGSGTLFSRRSPGWWVFTNGIEVHAPHPGAPEGDDVCLILFPGGRAYRYRGEALERNDGSLELHQRGGEEVIQVIHPDGSTSLEREFALYEKGNVFPLTATEGFRIVRLRAEVSIGGPAKVRIWWGNYRANEKAERVAFQEEAEAGPALTARWEHDAYMAVGVKTYSLKEGGELTLNVGRFPLRPHIPPDFLR